MSKLYVGNLSFSTTEEALKEVFESDGRKVTRISLILDRETGRSRGFAFIEMSSPADAESAIKACNELEVDGRRLKVNPAVERESRGGAPRGPRRDGPPGRPPRPGGPPGPGGYRGNSTDSARPYQGSRFPRPNSASPRGDAPGNSFNRGGYAGGAAGAGFAPPPDDEVAKDPGRKRREKPAKAKRKKNDEWNEGEVRGKRGRKRDDRW